MYEVLIESAAQADLNRLSADILRRIGPHLKALAENPRPPGCRKITGSHDDWRIRIGDYRVIYEIDDSSTTIRIMRVRHRREAYR